MKSYKNRGPGLEKHMNAYGHGALDSDTIESRLVFDLVLCFVWSIFFSYAHVGSLGRITCICPKGTLEGPAMIPR